MAARILLHIPSPARRGEVVELRATIGHAMETGLRPDSQGRTVPRNTITRFECRLDGVLVFGADLYPATAANPYLGFTLLAQRSGTLQFSWTGDQGFSHSETRPFTVT